jgi:hypothetical protein
MTDSGRRKLLTRRKYRRSRRVSRAVTVPDIRVRMVAVTPDRHEERFMNSTTRRLGVLAAAVAGIAGAGYGSAAAGMQHPGGTDAPPETTTPADGTEPMGTDMEMMEPPEFALDWTVEVTSEAEGEVVTANEVEFTVVPSGFEFSCEWSGKPVNEEFGHYHVLLD